MAHVSETFGACQKKKERKENHQIYACLFPLTIFKLEQKADARKRFINNATRGWSIATLPWQKLPQALPPPPSNNCNFLDAAMKHLNTHGWGQPWMSILKCSIMCMWLQGSTIAHLHTGAEKGFIASNCGRAFIDDMVLPSFGSTHHRSWRSKFVFEITF